MHAIVTSENDVLINNWFIPQQHSSGYEARGKFGEHKDA